MNIQLLEELCDVQGVAGCGGIRSAGTSPGEGQIVVSIKKANQTVSTERPLRVMYCAHNDECGFMVTEVTDDGYIRLRG